ncbi:SMP-30/gluconolactonase/LRE family protein [Sphingomonas tabacisoli]|uniref:SMP-30/gluconolactonase/LRE family protein n=1 Tax=Sphingomonas tabacisoli TaxID=2249466 RepID=A0ABW4I6L5_9SPHN
MSRYSGPAATLADGWSLDRVTQPSRLFGANGIAAGPDGRLYVAQVPGSQVSAIDIDTGIIETVSAMGGDIVAPDDLVFDEAANIYLTEITENRVCRRRPNGRVDVIRGDIPVANPITWHGGRLFAGECRIGARIMELPLDGSEPRVIASDVPMANAMQVGPDGKLYFPVMGTNQIWRVALDGGAPEVVAGDLGVPDSVKFDSKGRIITTQVASGQVLRIDPATGTREVLAQLAPGLDNCAFVGERLFVSSIPGEIVEIVAPGQARPIVSRGLQWPLGLAASDDGALFVADGAFSYRLAEAGALETLCMLFTPGGPGYVRGVCSGGAPGQWIVTTGLGGVARWSAGVEAEWLAQGLDRAMGVARTSRGMIIVAEYGAGRLLSVDASGVAELASGLDMPMGVAVDSDDGIYVAEAGAGRVVKVRGSNSETVADGLGRPEGLAWRDGELFALDTASKSVIRIDPLRGHQIAVASNLPVGAPVGVEPKPLGPIGDMAGPMINFAGVAAGADGSLYVSGDAEGSVLRLRSNLD